MLFKHPALVSVILNMVWLGGLHRALEDTIEGFAHLVSLMAAVLHLVLSKHTNGAHKVVEFSPTNTDIYQRVLTSLLADTFRSQITLLRDQIIQRGNSLLSHNSDTV